MPRPSAFATNPSKKGEAFWTDGNRRTSVQFHGGARGQRARDGGGPGSARTRGAGAAPVDRGGAEEPDPRARARLLELHALGVRQPGREALSSPPPGGR